MTVGCELPRSYPGAAVSALVALAAGVGAGSAWAQAAPSPSVPTSVPNSVPAGSAAAPASAPTAAPAGATEHDQVEVAPPEGVQVTALIVDNRLGNVRVEGHDRRVILISAHKRAPDTATLERLKVTLVPDPTGPVRITTEMAAAADSRPIPSGSVGIDLLIRAPRSASIKAEVWNGRLAVVGMENGADLIVNEGDIEVRNASGTIITQAAAGTHKLVDVVGKVWVQTIDGDLDLAAIYGERLEASVHKGRIDSREVRVREAWLQAIQGDIRFHGQALTGGRYRIGTVRGTIEVSLASAAPLSVLADARAGEVSLPASFERRKAPGREAESAVLGSYSRGTGAPAIVELRSRVGNIRFALIGGR